jgi:hypothetical protein
MSTAIELAKLVGRWGLYDPAGNGLVFGVTVIDAREHYGKTQILIQPKHGTGSAWVNLASVALSKD